MRASQDAYGQESPQDGCLRRGSTEKEGRGNNDTSANIQEEAEASKGSMHKEGEKHFRFAQKKVFMVGSNNHIDLRSRFGTANEVFKIILTIL